MNHHLHFRKRQVEQPAGLDQLQPLIEHRGRVDGDLVAHPPGRMGQRLGRVARRRSARPRTSDTAPAAGGEDERHVRFPPGRAGRGIAWKIAECSESTGRIVTYLRDLASSSSSFPAATSDSLFEASRQWLASRERPRASPASRGRPTMADRTRSTSSRREMSTSPCAHRDKFSRRGVQFPCKSFGRRVRRHRDGGRAKAIVDLLNRDLLQLRSSRLMRLRGTRRRGVRGLPAHWCRSIRSIREWQSVWTT